MQSIHKKKQKKNIFIFIAIVVVFIIVNPFDMFGSVRSIIMVPFAPLTHLGTNIGAYFFDKSNMILHIGTLYQQNQELSSNVRQLESKNSMLVDVKNENDLLRQNLSLLPREQFNFVGADVVLRDPLGGDQWVTINRGKQDGIEVGMVAVVDEGVFVGHVDEIDRTTARIKLITHPESVVNVVSARTGAEAIAYGEHGLSVVVEDIKKDDDVVDGDVFITSDIGNMFPRGLSVGTVQNMTTSTNNLFQRANIVPLVSLNDLRFVFIIK